MKSFQKSIQQESEEIMDTSDGFIDIQKAKSDLVDKDINVDIDSLHRCFEKLMATPDMPFQNALINAIVALSKSLTLEFKYHHHLETQRHFLNIIVIVMEIPLLHSPEFIDRAYPEFCKAVGFLPLSGQVRLAKYWSAFSAEKLRDMVLSLQQLITVKLIDNESKYTTRSFTLNDDESITGPVSVMKILYYASLYGGDKDSEEKLTEERQILESENELQHELLGGAGAMGVDMESKKLKSPCDDPLAKELDISHADCRNPLVSFDDFVNETLNENISMEVDYKYKLESESDEHPTKFSFANHSFILNMPSKQKSLYMDNRIQMYRERRTSVIQTLLHGFPTMPYLRIRVSRNRIIEDALVAVSNTMSCIMLLKGLI